MFYFHPALSDSQAITEICVNLRRSADRFEVPVQSLKVETIQQTVETVTDPIAVKHLKLPAKHPLLKTTECYFDQRNRPCGVFITCDNPIRNELHVPLCGGFTGFGVETHVTKSADSRGANHYEAVIRSLEDVQKMQPSRVQLDMGESERRTEIMQDLLGDLMDVQQKGMFRSICVPIDDFATLCGLDNIYMDMIDQPEMIHAALGLMIDSWIDGVRELERVGALSLGIHNEYCGAGGVSYTNDLPQKDFDGTHVRLKDLWGFAAAQMFSEVSPDMHEEFAVQHEKKFLALFGLNSYGCCEPLHNKLDMLIRNIPNLRRFSISPWADVEKCAEKLQNKYIYSYKPNPAMLASETFNPEAVRRSITEFCEKTKGCVTEIVMKDTHTLRNEPHRLSEWVRITKEVVAEFHG
jgi:hypothetical protein